MHTQFSIYIQNGKLTLSVWHGTKDLRFHRITHKAAVAITNRLIRLGFTFGPRQAQFGWIAGRTVTQ